MQKSTVVLCPACGGVVEVGNKMLFFACPHCGESASASVGRGLLEEMCADPSAVAEVIDLCLNLEQENGPDAALEILNLLAQHNPHNEELAFTLIRMAGYPLDMVGRYLTMFSAAKKVTPFAAEFLDHTIDPEYAMLVNQLEQYAENKLQPEKQKKYKERIAELRANYTGRNRVSSGMMLMNVFYIIGAVVNVAAAVFFLVVPIKIYWNIIIAIAVFAAEMLLLFLHNRSYGNRLGMDMRERIMLIIFMSSIFVAIGAIPIGWVIN